MRTEYIHRQEMAHILAALTPPNRLACEISMSTGLRISDVLGLRTEALRGTTDGRLSVRESKTGKLRRVKLAREYIKRALSMAGKVYVFAHRTDWRKHRTRQAVYKDLKRAAALYRVQANIAPHSLRKIYAVDARNRAGGDTKRVQRLLCHTDEAVTMIYAMADELTARRRGKPKAKP